jgi:FecR protein
MRVFIFILSVAALAIGLINQQLFAGGAIINAGVVVFKSGDAQVTRADKSIKQTFKDDVLQVGDTIETKNGRLQFELSDGSQISLQPNTVYALEKYSYTTKPASLVATLQKGGLRTQTGAICQQNPKNCQLRTQFGNINSQKAEFTVMYEAGLKLTANSGQVDVCNESGCLSASAGQTITVKAANKPPQLASLAL